MLIWLDDRNIRARRARKKLHTRFYGSSSIIERHGPLAYRLRIPDSLGIQGIFTVDLLKAYLEPVGDQTLMPFKPSWSPGVKMGGRSDP